MQRGERGKGGSAEARDASAPNEGAARVLACASACVRARAQVRTSTSQTHGQQQWYVSPVMAPPPATGRRYR